MTENTTAAPMVVGEPHRHPAVRRLARACIALVRWQREQAVSVPAPVEDKAGPSAAEPGQ